MVIDKDFYVDNYVGTYRFEFDKELCQMIIVSEEYNHPMAGEPELKKKRIFEYDARDNDYIYLNFANVDIDSDSAILSYCNRYGLPYSSQLIRDKMFWIGPDIDDETARIVAQSSPSKYARNDLMSVTGFCEAVIIVRKLMRLRALINEKQLSNASYTELISTLLFFLFFSHENHYEYNLKEDVLPKERLSRFQYEFQLFRRRNGFDTRYPSWAGIVSFLHHIENLRKYTENLESLQLRVDLSARAVEQTVAILSPLLDNHFFLCESYGDIEFEDELTCNEDQDSMETLRQFGVEVFRSVINDGLGFTTPSLNWENEALHGSWQLSYQMNGIYMEMFLEAAMNAMVRQCANPTCGKFFSVSRGRPNKRFCCHECAVLEAKRRERRRKRKG